MREEPGDGVVDDPWARPPGGSDGHRPGDWGGEPEAPPAGRPSKVRGYWDDEHGETPVPPPRDVGAVRSPRPRLRAAKIAVWAASIALLVDVPVSALGYDETRRAIDAEERGSSTPLDDLDPSTTSVDALNALLDVQTVVYLVSGFALIACAVFVIRWQNVVMRNVAALGVRRRYSPVKAGWSWFVPIWFLFGPKRAYNDAWRAAEPEGETRTGREHFVHRAVPQVFQVWWLFWLVGLLFEVPSGWSEAVTLGDQRSAFITGACTSLATFIAGPLFVIVMERITERHEARRHEAPAAGTA